MSRRHEASLRSIAHNAGVPGAKQIGEPPATKPSTLKRDESPLTSRRAWAIVAALTAVALALRLVALRQPAAGDEIFLYAIVHGHSLGDALRLVHDTESTPPLHFIIAWAASRVGGDDLLWIKVPSFVLGTATVPLIYLLGLRTVGRAAALVGAAIFALCAFDVFYGVEGRAYAMVAFLCAASTLALLELLSTGRRRWAIALAILTAAALYTHYTTVFVLAAQLVWALIVRRDRAKLVLGSYAAAALAYVPWIPSFVVQSHDSAAVRIKALYPLTPSSFVTGTLKALVAHPAEPLDRVPGVIGCVLLVAGVAIGAGVGVLRVVRNGRVGIRREMLLLVLLAVVTPICALVYSLGPTSIFLPRNMSASIPAAVLAIGALVTVPRLAMAAVASVAVVAGVAIGGVRGLRPEYGRPDYRAAAHYIDAAAAPQDPVVDLDISSGAVSTQTHYWFRRPHRYFGNARRLLPALAAARPTDRVFVVSPVPDNRFIAFFGIDKHGFRLAQRRSFRGGARVTVLTYVPRR